ncbi:hypothetical protein P175DRAFT_0532098 [Aspergillus ochraceoroseus IBT 24754]|uniref:N-acetyltransferase domain-containing protein n=2 Tax=Aspergillus subgen. Nidulantes TaxID=2720870 RepID=A0A0F8X2C3_9EURO|nr:uncharacterized protein P175DRAFT_0532098 [Aspergillus ochraceoroseus IBT 24754]KKK23820.1 hypothetical protein ARAM_001517 [Aspergillus rambellii]PTU20742.1 hypothetical protein P175DRAFT_0532098 [Aspergillus ochraceoroseus IBT 24754]
MLLNATTAISTSKVLLVPYAKWHVLRYHEWMKDEEIQEATASEPLTLEEEYAMQESWRNDPDKLTFIICLPARNPHGNTPHLTEECDAPARMVGDINLFLRIEDGGEEGSRPQIIGEIELMIAEKKDQRRGFGKAALLAFLRYVIGHEKDLVREFLSRDEMEGSDAKIAALSVKIGQANERSLALFEGVQFRRISAEPNYFREWELRRTDLRRVSVEDALVGAGVGGYVEVLYERSQ